MEIKTECKPNVVVECALCSELNMFVYVIKDNDNMFCMCKKCFEKMYKYIIERSKNR